MQDLIKGAVFFSCFLPSFTRIGYRSRSWMWPQNAPDFGGQRWLVTGASDGIGKEIAQQAAAQGAEVHAIGRSDTKLQALKASPGSWHLYPADLSQMGVIRQLTEHLITGLKTFDVLVNNVGLMLNQPTTTIEGLEASFATNLLGHYALTEGLRDGGALQHGTVINMSSGGMYNVPLDLEQLQGCEPYDGMLTYAYQKRAQVVLNNWWREQGLNAYVMHPGWVDTAGVRSAMPAFHRLTKAVLRNTPMGADTALWLAAQQPVQSNPHTIWFDRAARATHVFAATRNGVGPLALIEHLQQALSTALSNALATAPSTAPAPAPPATQQAAPVEDAALSRA